MTSITECVLQRGKRHASQYRRWLRQRPKFNAKDEVQYWKTIEAEEAALEEVGDEDHLLTYCRLPSGRWILVNGPVTTIVSEAEARSFSQPWKFPVAFFYSRLPVVYHTTFLHSLPPSGPPLAKGVDFLNMRSIALTTTTENFTPLTLQEVVQIERGDVTVALDAEHVVSDYIEHCRESMLGSHEVTRTGRISIVRSDGSGRPLMDCYIHFVDEPLDYKTAFSGLTPGDLDIRSSEHFLCSYKNALQLMRYLVEKGCK